MKPPVRLTQLEALDAWQCAAHAKEREKFRARTKRRVRPWTERRQESEQKAWREESISGVKMYPVLTREASRKEREKSKREKEKREVGGEWTDSDLSDDFLSESHMFCSIKGRNMFAISVLEGKCPTRTESF